MVCTKLPLTQAEEDNLAPAVDFATRVDGSLTRLQRGHIDILLLHNPRDELDWPQFDQSVFRCLQEQGKIIAYGVSSRSLAGARRVIAAGFGSCLEWAFHLFERRPAEILFPDLASRRMNFVARSPLSRGLISRKYLGNSHVRFDPSTFRSTLPQAWIDWTVECLQQLKVLGIDPETIVTFALRYCLSYPEVSMVVPGLRSKRHIDALIKAASSGPLEADRIRDLEQAIPASYPPWS